ncbi:MAG TPA: hypothetical protein DIT13_01285 [Verrucomicrobiales bacterium]|mgnify:CR=1 FL=1|nr:hypothetical protein [Verrucomicrobiales bacterium]HRJ09059.1 hypothetical protein [Prosthecobacter sp.]HRK15348.1 hypothetical protein [Prosthecobacter sp.]
MKSRQILRAAFALILCTGWTPQSFVPRLNDAGRAGNGTTLLPVRGEPLPPGKNALWCATLQMAWDKACGDFGGPIRLLPASPAAEALNRGRFNPAWIDNESVLTFGGLAGDGVLDAIEKGIKTRGWPASRMVPALRKDILPGDLVFHAVLSKSLSFPEPFAKLGHTRVGRKSTSWFGFHPQLLEANRLREQVRVHDYQSDENFVIELASKNSLDQLILARIDTPPRSLDAVSKQLISRLKRAAPHALPADVLAVPNIVVDEKNSFPQIEGRKVAGSGIYLRRALQTVDFRMDEKGVKLRSEASIAFGCSAHYSTGQPRLFILTPPFALLMKRTGAPEPYFIAWIANLDALAD